MRSGDFGPSQGNKVTVIAIASQPGNRGLAALGRGCLEESGSDAPEIRLAYPDAPEMAGGGSARTSGPARHDLAL